MANVQLTPDQARIVSRVVEFSINSRMSSLIAAFPSVTFERKGTNGGVTVDYKLTGPSVWVEKIEKRYSYGA